MKHQRGGWQGRGMRRDWESYYITVQHERIARQALFAPKFLGAASSRPALEHGAQLQAGSSTDLDGVSTEVEWMLDYVRCLTCLQYVGSSNIVLHKALVELLENITMSRGRMLEFKPGSGPWNAALKAVNKEVEARRAASQKWLFESGGITPDVLSKLQSEGYSLGAIYDAVRTAGFDYFSALVIGTGGDPHHPRPREDDIFPTD